MIPFDAIIRTVDVPCWQLEFRKDLSAPRFPRENWDMWGFIVDGVSLVLLSVAVLLILLILIQRGKGGGFIGALDGSIPFGSRARHQFTRWTIYSALALLYLTMFLVKMIQMGP